VTTGQSGDARQVIVARRRHEITGEVQGEPRAAACVAGTTGLPMHTFRAARQTAAERVLTSSSSLQRADHADPP